MNINDLGILNIKTVCLPVTALVFLLVIFSFFMCVSGDSRPRRAGTSPLQQGSVRSEVSLISVTHLP